MQHKPIYAVIILLLFSFIANAQSINPYKDIDKKQETVTLTKGEYEEVFDEDSIQRIGSALVNIHTMKVVGVNITEEEQRKLDDSRESRFLSVDPIAGKYPELTPYQFASNRPIDGIDVDGLEYLTYTYVFDATGATTKLTSSTYTWFNPAQHNAHGHLGRGVQYIFRTYDANDKKKWTVYSEFVERQAKIPVFGYTDYGNYYGATTLFNVVNNRYGVFDRNSDDKFIDAVDQVDNFAKSHDLGYDKLDAVGDDALFHDWGTTPIDEAAFHGWENFWDTKKIGDPDPYNQQPISSDEMIACWKGKQLFAKIIFDKKNEISNFMKANYSSEAKAAGFGTTEYNYNLFLEKYLTKDTEGSWIRKDGMWSKNEDGDWTPNKPKKDE